MSAASSAGGTAAAAQVNSNNKKRPHAEPDAPGEASSAKRAKVSVGPDRGESRTTAVSAPSAGVAATLPSYVPCPPVTGSVPTASIQWVDVADECDEALARMLALRGPVSSVGLVVPLFSYSEPDVVAISIDVPNTTTKEVLIVDVRTTGSLGSVLSELLESTSIAKVVFGSVGKITSALRSSLDVELKGVINLEEVTNNLVPAKDRSPIDKVVKALLSRDSPNMALAREEAKKEEKIEFVRPLPAVFVEAIAEEVKNLTDCLARAK